MSETTPPQTGGKILKIIALILVVIATGAMGGYALYLRYFVEGDRIESEQVLEFENVSGNLSITNSKGLIRIMPSDDGKMRVSLIKRVRPPALEIGTSGPDLIALQHTQNDQGDVSLQIDYTEHRKYILEAELWVFMPRAAKIDIRTGNGNVYMKGIEAGQIDLRSDGEHADMLLINVSGAVHIKMAGGQFHRYEHGGQETTADTDSASIRLVFLDPTTGRTEITTKSGPVVLHLLENADATISYRTKGLFLTTFDVELPPMSPPEETQGQLMLGDGGTEIELTSETGAIRVEKGLPPIPE